MIPIYLNPAATRIALVGRGRLTVRRLAWLREGGAKPDVWSDAPSIDLAAASPELSPRLPKQTDIEGYHAIWIADLEQEAATLAQWARAAGVLVNVEDVIPLCDFHTPAVVRRGQLTLTAGTGGASPAVARAARERLEEAFPKVWGDALVEIAEARAVLRSDGAAFETLVADARARLAHHGLV
ncbi:precorrin-2 dehydrogenase/sirohydrochlorin ferrochelatase family protein [Terricaulis silvestris]|uniref:precorrin-2 dehydrogenase n=1 Tax=Terricaulis silvestris TaxID=2686094 RepID=A0A6I6MPY8_9CAUL|nr:NAD(P)-dependent oxidoreductase [Terricaulis silvestris]QGZ96231.1 Precorrin-2 dehydrogenase [Terricaulis silvestris]